MEEDFLIFCGYVTSINDTFFHVINGTQLRIKKKSTSWALQWHILSFFRFTPQEVSARNCRKTDLFANWFAGRNRFVNRIKPVSTQEVSTRNCRKSASFANWFAGRNRFVNRIKPVSSWNFYINAKCSYMKFDQNSVRENLERLNYFFATAYLKFWRRIRNTKIIISFFFCKVFNVFPQCFFFK